jgi:hypothetical protein
MPKEDYIVDGLLFTPFMREDESIDDYVEVEGLFINEENNIYHLYNTNGEYITLHLKPQNKSKELYPKVLHNDVVENRRKVAEFNGIKEATDAYMKDVYFTLVEE